MRFRADVWLRREERCLERVLALAGRRGYEIVGCEARLDDYGKAMRVRLELVSERAPEQLERHLRKLHETLDVRLTPGYRERAIA